MGLTPRPATSMRHACAGVRHVVGAGAAAAAAHLPSISALPSRLRPSMALEPEEAGHRVAALWAGDWALPPSGALLPPHRLGS